MASAKHRPEPDGPRDHLFISYASEDLPFVRWLALKLKLLGYRVWWDRENLLGGERFPPAIDRALKSRTFRFLAVLSNISMFKSSPQAERAAARRIADERHENFLIPLNLDQTPAERSWTEADLTTIEFKDNWAGGLAILLQQLREQGAPCFPDEKSALVAGNLSPPSFVIATPEPAWLNLFPLENIPEHLTHYTFDRALSSTVLQNWTYRQHGDAYWSFEPAPDIPGVPAPRIGHSKVTSYPDKNGLRTSNIAIDLLRQHVERHCHSLGLAETDRGRVFYFPTSHVVATRLTFTLPTARQTWIKPVGTKKIWHGKRPEEVQRHLAFMPRIELRRYGQPVLQIRPTVHFTEIGGGDLDTKRNVRRAKAVRGSWYNDKWLARISAIGSFLANGQDHWRFAPTLPMRISRIPLTLTMPRRLDEAAREHFRSHGSNNDDMQDEDDLDLHLDEFDSEGHDE